MLKRKNYRYDKKGRLIKDKYYFFSLLIFKYILSYPNTQNDNVTATLYLFGFLPIKKFCVTAEMLLQKSIRGGGINIVLMPLILWHWILHKP